METINGLRFSETKMDVCDIVSDDFTQFPEALQ